MAFVSSRRGRGRERNPSLPEHRDLRLRSWGTRSRHVDRHGAASARPVRIGRSAELRQAFARRGACRSQGGADLDGGFGPAGGLSRTHEV